MPPGETAPEFRICVYHHEHKSKIERNEQDIQKLWSEEEGLGKLQKEIDTMKTWIILGSGSMILSGIIVIVQFVLNM